MLVFAPEHGQLLQLRDPQERENRRRITAWTPFRARF